MQREQHKTETLKMLPPGWVHKSIYTPKSTFWSVQYDEQLIILLHKESYTIENIDILILDN